LVFAFLGVASDANKLCISIDYSMSVQEVFTTATRAILSIGDIGILAFAQHPLTAPDLPSWVPDVCVFYLLFFYLDC